MTYREIQIVSWTCVVFGWAFLVFQKPEITLGFFFAALGGFVWGGIKNRWSRK